LGPCADHVLSHRARSAVMTCCELYPRRVGWGTVVARHPILALLVAILWLVGCAPIESPIADANERVSQAGDIDALPARRAGRPQILCPSKHADTNGNSCPHSLAS